MDPLTSITPTQRYFQSLADDTLGTKNFKKKGERNPPTAVASATNEE
jgi:hypothetical protein